MILGDDKAESMQRMNGMQWNGELRAGFGGMGEWYDEPYDPYADAAHAQAIDDAQAAADAQAYADQQAADAAYAVDAAQAATDAQDYANAQAAAAQAIDDAQRAQDYADAKATAAVPAYGASYRVTGATSGGGMIGNEVLPSYPATPTPQATPPASTASNGLWALLFGTPKVTATPTDQPRAQPGQTSVPGYFPSSIPANQYNPATVYRDARGQIVRYVPETTLTGQVVYRPATGTPMGPSRPAAPGQSVSVAGFSGSTGILAIGALVAFALISSKG